jgi:AcrR family transcriptional regulator
MMSIDRRVARSRTALADALVALIGRKSYDEITVEDILTEADVGRATFYAHFTSKDDLLRRSLDRLRALLVAAFEGASSAPFPLHPEWSPSRTLFEHVAQFSDVQSALDGGRGGAIVWAAFEGAIAGFLRSALPAELRMGLPRELVIRDMVARVTTVLRWWLEDKPALTARQAHEQFELLLSQQVSPEVFSVFTSARQTGRD